MGKFSCFYVLNTDSISMEMGEKHFSKAMLRCMSTTAVENYCVHVQQVTIRTMQSSFTVLPEENLTTCSPIVQVYRAMFCSLHVCTCGFITTAPASGPTGKLHHLQCFHGIAAETQNLSEAKNAKTFSLKTPSNKRDPTSVDGGKLLSSVRRR